MSHTFTACLVGLTVPDPRAWLVADGRPSDRKRRKARERRRWKKIRRKQGRA